MHDSTLFGMNSDRDFFDSIVRAKGKYSSGKNLKWNYFFLANRENSFDKP